MTNHIDERIDVTENFSCLIIKSIYNRLLSNGFINEFKPTKKGSAIDMVSTHSYGDIKYKMGTEIKVRNKDFDKNNFAELKIKKKEHIFNKFGDMKELRYVILDVRKKYAYIFNLQKIKWETLETDVFINNKVTQANKYSNHIDEPYYKLPLTLCTKIVPLNNVEIKYISNAYSTKDYKH